MYRIIKLLFLIALTSCSYQVSRFGYKSPNTKKQVDTCDITLKEFFITDGLDIKHLGTIQLGETGSTIRCKKEDAMKFLINEGCAINANFINIIDEIFPDVISTCYRCTAELYYADGINLFILKYLEKRDTLIYSKSNKLKWSDFRASPTNLIDIQGDLKTSLNLSTRKVNTLTGYTLYDCQGIVFRDASWIKPREKNDTTLLYFQLQFDIAELFAKKAEVNINASNTTMGRNDFIQNIFSSYIKKMREMQKTFMIETSYGSNFDKLADWSKKISAELKEMDR